MLDSNFCLEENHEEAVVFEEKHLPYEENHKSIARTLPSDAYCLEQFMASTFHKKHFLYFSFVIRRTRNVQSNAKGIQG